MKHKISLNWKAILSKKRRETSASVEYSALLQKLNPVNFMHPYDAEKVRIANDLYSALLKSKGNDTIIQMIYEKGKDELGMFKGAKGPSRVEPVDSSDHTDRTGEMLLWLRFFAQQLDGLCEFGVIVQRSNWFSSRFAPHRLASALS